MALSPALRLPANFGTNFWTITADNGTFPATTNTLKIVVLAGGLTGPVEVVSREYWDGVENPHAARWCDADG